MPFEPEVFANAVSPRWSKASRSESATSAHSTIVAGAPGSRSKAIIVGRVTSSARASDVCSSRSARLASQTSVGRSSGEAEVDRAPVAAAVDRGRLHPVGPVRRALLLVEVLCLDAVGVALERQGATAQVGEQRRGDAAVVVDHVALREARDGVEDLVQVRERQPPPLDLDLDASGRRHPSTLAPRGRSGRRHLKAVAPPGRRRSLGRAARAGDLAGGRRDRLGVDAGGLAAARRACRRSACRGRPA